MGPLIREEKKPQHLVLVQVAVGAKLCCLLYVSLQQPLQQLMNELVLLFPFYSYLFKIFFAYICICYFQLAKLCKCWIFALIFHFSLSCESLCPSIAGISLSFSPSYCHSSLTLQHFPVFLSPHYIPSLTLRQLF